MLRGALRDNTCFLLSRRRASVPCLCELFPSDLPSSDFSSLDPPQSRRTFRDAASRFLSLLSSRLLPLSLSFSLLFLFPSLFFSLFPFVLLVP